MANATRPASSSRVRPRPRGHMVLAGALQLALAAALLAGRANAVRIVGSDRLAVELTHHAVLAPSESEPAFATGVSDAHCVLTSAGDGFAVGMPTAQVLNASESKSALRKNLMSGLIIVPATVEGPGSVACELPELGSAGNTSLCVVLGPVDPWAAPPPKGACSSGTGNTSYAPAFYTRFALFSPQFGRRPFIRELNGSVIMLTDSTLKGQTLRFSSTVAGQAISGTVPGGGNVSIPFALAGMPLTVMEDVELSLTLTLPPGQGSGGVATVSHTRTFVRVPPPALGSGIVTWQVDHTSKGLLVDGAPFVAAGWFGSGGLMESVGLPPEAAIEAAAKGAPTLTLDELSVLSKASVDTEWARHGHTFVKADFVPRAGSADWEKDSVRLAIEYLDLAASAGIYVLVDVAEDGLALAMSGQDKKKTGEVRNVTQFREWLHGNISIYKNHPALGGYYGCDDCCHTSIAIEHNRGAHCQDGNTSTTPVPHAGRGTVSGCPSEYYSMANIRREIWKADPYHLVFGAVARCYGNGAWYWSEEGVGLAIDVPMHESYGSGINTGAGGQRVFPMEWSPLINMPDPHSVGQTSAVHARIYGDGLSGDSWGINAL